MRSAVFVLACASLHAQWDRFRGPNGSGVSKEENLPAEFGPAKNVAWKVAVPFGRSSPVAAGGRIFLTAVDGGKLTTLAWDAASGRELWRRVLPRMREQPVYKANDAASPTPAAGPDAVYVFFPDSGLAAYSFDGKELWRHPLGPFDSFYGIASSPVFAGGSVYLLCEQASDSFLLAVDAKTGRQRWKTARPGGLDGWSSPVVHGERLLIFGTTRMEAFFLATGERDWWIPISSNGSLGTPVIFGETVIVAASGSDQPWMPTWDATLAKLDKNRDGRLSHEECKDEKDWFEHFGWVDSNHDRFLSGAEWNAARSLGAGEYGLLAIALGGKGRLPESAVRWRVKRGVPYVPAPLAYEGAIFMIKDGGLFTALDPATGAAVKQGRAPGAGGQYLASPVAADGKVYTVSEEGKFTVWKAGSWEPLASNDMGEECHATPAIANGRIFVRTRSSLYAFQARR